MPTPGRFSCQSSHTLGCASHINRSLRAFFGSSRPMQVDSGRSLEEKYHYLSTGCWNCSRRVPHSLAKIIMPLQEGGSGEMAEWLKAHAWKACVRETVPWVRIPLSPPNPIDSK